VRILVVSTLKRKVGPDVFASRSRIIYQLATGLAKKGHQVSLLGTKDSQLEGVNVIPLLDKCWIDLPPVENEFLRQTASLILQAKKIIEIQGSFDVVHNHTYPDFFPSVLENELKIPMVTTLHALYDDYMDDLLSKFKKTNFIALSQAYKRLYKKASIYDVVYNGVDANLYSFKQQKSDYLLWLGRLPKGKNADGTFIDPKGVRWAIQLAQKTGSKLLLSGVCEDKKFFEADVKPYLNDKIQWVGEVSTEQSLPVEKVVELMQNAKAFLMTINQEEPFGLVMAEAMACGTPVIAFKRGSTEEVIVDGKTGFLVDPQKGVEGLAEAFSKISTISPRNCRTHIEQNFTLEKMVDNYEKVYTKLIKG
jgi:glycosyltransferase involved in cell wall biosynthesis